MHPMITSTFALLRVLLLLVFITSCTEPLKAVSPPEAEKPFDPRRSQVTRGPSCTSNEFYVLAPRGIGQTHRSHPSLFWYYPKKTECPIELTLAENEGKMVFRTPLSAQKEDIQHLELREFNDRLEQHLKDGVEYQWSIAIITDVNSPSTKSVAKGFIKKSQAPVDTSERLSAQDQIKKIETYAETGYWYDAFALVLDLLQENSRDCDLWQRFTELLSQEDLPEDIAFSSRDAKRCLRRL